jgi:hypothetical protein
LLEREGAPMSAASTIYSLWWYSSRIGQIDMKNHSIRIGKEKNMG